MSVDTSVLSSVFVEAETTDIQAGMCPCDTDDVQC